MKRRPIVFEWNNSWIAWNSKKKKLGWWGSLYVVNISKSFQSSIICWTKLIKWEKCIIYCCLCLWFEVHHFSTFYQLKNDKGDNEDLIEMINNSTSHTRRTFYINKWLYTFIHDWIWKAPQLLFYWEMLMSAVRHWLRI